MNTLTPSKGTPADTPFFNKFSGEDTVTIDPVSVDP
jgi:hypothetical protein